MTIKCIRRQLAGGHLLVLAGCALAMGLLLPAGAHAATIVSTNNADLTAATTWPGGAPVAGDANLWQTKGSGVGSALTWPGAPVSFTFNGQTLELVSGGSLTHSSASTTQYHLNNVILDAGGKISHGANSAWNLAFDADGSTHTLQLNGGTITLNNSSTSDTLVFSKVNLAGSGTVTITRTLAATNVIDFSAATVDPHLFTGIFSVTSGGFTGKPTIINLPAITDAKESFELDLTDGSSQWTNANSIAVKTLKLWNNSSATLDTIAAGTYTAASLGANYATCFSLPGDATHTIQVGHSVTYNANGGTGAPGTIWYVNPATLATGAGLTYAGHAFDHWNTAADNSGTSYAGGAAAALATNTTLYAQWSGIITVASPLPGALATVQGTASAAQSVSVTASGLSAGITVGPTTGLEFSSDDSTWGSTAALSATGGTLYVRLSATATAGSYNSAAIALVSGTAGAATATTASGNLVAANPTWNSTTGGNWGSAGNWLSSIIASGSGVTADFSQVDITSDTTVHLDSGYTVGSLIFGNTDVAPAANWIVDNNGSAGNTLTLAGGTPTVTVNNLGSGMATISAEIDGTNFIKAGIGTLTLSPGAATDTMGSLKAAAGGLTLNSGTLNVTNTGTPAANGLWIAGSTLTVAGGILNATNGQVTINGGGTLLVTNGTCNANGLSMLNGYASAGTVTVGGTGLLNLFVLRVTQALTAPGGVVNLNGGTLQLNSFTSGGATSVGAVNFNGTTVQAKSTTTAFTYVTNNNNLTYNVLTGGAIFDTANYSITIGSPLVSGSSPDGGLTKLGSGTLTLTNANTYSGNTTIGNGVLALGAYGSITNSAAIVVASNAVFDVSGLSSPFTLAQATGQTLSNSAPGAAISGANNCSAGTLALVYDGVHPCFLQTNGSMTLSASTVLQINNTGAQLAAGSYTLITNTATGNVAGTVTASPVTVGGNGASGTATLAVVNNQLVLTVAGGGGAPGKFSGISVSGTGLTLTVTNGPANGPWTLLESTNLLLPVAQWSTNRTGNYDGSGNLTTNILNAATNPAAFFLLK